MKISLVAHPDGLHLVMQANANSMAANKDSTPTRAKLRGQCGNDTSSPKSWKRESATAWQQAKVPRPQEPSCEANVQTGRPIQKVGNANLRPHGSKQRPHADRSQVARPMCKQDVQSKKLETHMLENIAPERSSTFTKAGSRSQGGHGTVGPKSWKREFATAWQQRKVPRPQEPSSEANVQTGRPVHRVGNANLRLHGSKQMLHAHRSQVARPMCKQDVQSKKLETHMLENIAPERSSTLTGAESRSQGRNLTFGPNSWKRDIWDRTAANKASTHTRAKLRSQGGNGTSSQKRWKL